MPKGMVGFQKGNILWKRAKMTRSPRHLESLHEGHRQFLKKKSSRQVLSHSGSENGRFSHGHYVGGESAEHHAFANAKQRCENPRNNRFADYGGRGIKFKFSSFDRFLSELGPRPRGKKLDRINNNGHYEPGNVRWATESESVRNRRSSGGSGVRDSLTGRFI